MALSLAEGLAFLHEERWQDGEYPATWREESVVAPMSPVLPPLRGEGLHQAEPHDLCPQASTNQVSLTET